MDNSTDPLYSRSVVEFVAAANEFCRYTEMAADLKGEELLKILQRILPFMYIKASLLPQLEPYFEEGNEKFVTEADWNRINSILIQKFGSADEYLEVFDAKASETDGPVVATISENIADIYQDIKDFLLLYQTGTAEVMNDAVWECRMNFENFWGQKLVNVLRAIHSFLYSGEQITEAELPDSDTTAENTDTSDWVISRMQKDFRGDAK